MSVNPIIMKFGGTSVQDSEAFSRVAGIVASRAQDHPVVVVSAMSGFTNALLDSFGRASKGDFDEALKTVDRHLVRHRDVALSLLAESDFREFEDFLDKSKTELIELLQPRPQGPSTQSYPGLQDAVVCYGELLSSRLLSLVLRNNGVPSRCVDARRCIVTDGTHGRAAPDFQLTAVATRAELGPILQSGEVPVLGGFIGASRDGATTTLGRGGSDYSAAIIASPIDAREIQIWTDVTGVLTADPRIVAGAKTVPYLSYSEAAELAYFGAKVLHPKTIHPAVERKIPVRICNSLRPAEAGTLVLSESTHAPWTVKAIAHKVNVTTVQITSARMLGAYGFLKGIFETFDRNRTVVDVVTTSEVSVSLSLDDTSSLESIVRDLREIGDVSIERGRAIVCVVGEGLGHTAGIAGRVFRCLADINVYLISQGASRINLTFAVDENHVIETVNRLHTEFFGD